MLISWVSLKLENEFFFMLYQIWYDIECITVVHKDVFSYCEKGVSQYIK